MPVLKSMFLLEGDNNCSSLLFERLSFTSARAIKSSTSSLDKDENSSIRYDIETEISSPYFSEVGEEPVRI